MNYLKLANQVYASRARVKTCGCVHTEIFVSVIASPSILIQVGTQLRNHVLQLLLVNVTISASFYLYKGRYLGDK